MSRIRCLIIDDEALARGLVKAYLKEEQDVEIVAECADGFEGIKAIQEHQPDLIFLDVQMPRISGLEMLELIEKKPVVIFTTAFQEHAIRAFELNAADYLLKPFTKERFLQSLEKAREKISRGPSSADLNQVIQQHAQENKPGRIVVKTATAIKVIPLEQVLYLEAQDDYVMVYTREGKFLKQQTMKFFEQVLDPHRFLRIHRSYIVNVNEVLRIEPMDKTSYLMILKDNSRLPISRSGYSLVKKVLDF